MNNTNFHHEIKMFENFTDRAYRVMNKAQTEARHFNHENVRTEHILLALLREEAGMHIVILESYVDPRKIRLEVEKLMCTHPAKGTIDSVPLTPAAEDVIEYTKEAARELDHNYVGTEHILLGLLIVRGGTAAQVLERFGLNVSDVRDKIRRLTNGDAVRPIGQLVPPAQTMRQLALAALADARPQEYYTHLDAASIYATLELADAIRSRNVAPTWTVTR
jgi:ATP-dependent Clp protease ATP-binding subunit ClpA